MSKKKPDASVLNAGIAMLVGMTFDGMENKWEKHLNRLQIVKRNIETQEKAIPDPVDGDEFIEEVEQESYWTEEGYHKWCNRAKEYLSNQEAAAQSFRALHESIEAHGMTTEWTVNEKRLKGIEVELAEMKKSALCP
jgi:hypothetical protein